MSVSAGGRGVCTGSSSACVTGTCAAGLVGGTGAGTSAKYASKVKMQHARNHCEVQIAKCISVRKLRSFSSKKSEEIPNTKNDTSTEARIISPAYSGAALRHARGNMRGHSSGRHASSAVRQHTVCQNCWRMMSVFFMGSGRGIRWHTLEGNVQGRLAVCSASPVPVPKPVLCVHSPS